MRVVEVISDTNIGGAGVVLLNRLRHAEKGINTVVLLPKGSLLLPRLREIGARVVELDGCRDRSLDLLAIPELLYKLRRLKPDIVNSHGCLSSRIAALFSGARASVYTRHCSYRLPRIYEYKATRLAFRALSDLLCDAVIAVSPVVQRDLIKMGEEPRKIAVIVNGAEQLERTDGCERQEKRLALGIPARDRVVGIFARLEPCKDHICFLKAARVLLSTSPEYSFLIVGTGSTEQKLKALCKRLGIAEKVVFTGFVGDISPLMSITDVNVNCSVGTETSSLALSEGMSLGVPCVASDFGGNPYMVNDGVNGFLYPRGDHKALAERILRLSDSRLYAACSHHSRKRFEKELNAKRMAARTYSFYKELLKRKEKNG